MFPNFSFLISNLVNSDRNYPHKQKLFDMFNTFFSGKGSWNQSLRTTDPSSHYYTTEGGLGEFPTQSAFHLGRPSLLILASQSVLPISLCLTKSCPFFQAHLKCPHIQEDLPGYP